MKATKYFENEVLKKRPYIRPEWCEWVVRHPVHTEEEWREGEKRIRYWGCVEEMRETTGIDKYLRVITLADGETLHNAMPDARFTRRQRRQK